MYEMLKELTQIWGVSGYETLVSDYIVDQVMDYADEIKRDAIGNLIVLKKGNGQDKKKIMCAAHMDEIGVSIVKIESNGMLRVKKMGGVDPHIAYMNRVQFRNGLVGTVGCESKIADVKAGSSLEKFFVDIGARSKEEAEEYVRVGDPAMFIGEYVELAGRSIMAKAFDDRSACYIQIEALKQMKTPYHDVYFVFTVQEEVGLFGGTTSAEGIHPDLGIAVDITGCFDVPGNQYGNPVLGGGAAIKVNDSSVICDEGLVQAMIDCAYKNQIKYQLDPLPFGGTDAGAINKSNAGVKAVGISIPTRYGHSPSSIIDMDDVDACVALLTKYAESPLEIVTETIFK